MAKVDLKTWLDVLQIVIPALLIVGGGAVAYWKYLQEKGRLLRLDSQKEDQILGEYKLEAERAAWEQVKHVIEMQAIRIDAQEARIASLEQDVEMWKQKFDDAIHDIEDLENKFDECQKVREMLLTKLREYEESE